MAGKSPGPFPNCDWRFNEFPNPAAHALHVTCVELMALAVPGKDVGNALLNEPYWIVLHDRIVSVLSSPTLTSETESAGYPFALLDFTACHQSYSEMNCSYVLALTHAAVDQHCQHLSYMDPICDFLYHIKYMYTGDSVKEQVSLCRR
ncbi:hypothetical protein XENOCAPTIV_001760 [Xenoophorus captivus]|uniref:Mediator of RNA polymerase II transcription subunit 23 n=1 Tax=Xenoophorus captivus TaxID=1517983 RepID=A0ABV0RQ11_9TELE